MVRLQKRKIQNIIIVTALAIIAILVSAIVFLPSNPAFFVLQPSASPPESYTPLLDNTAKGIARLSNGTYVVAWSYLNPYMRANYKVTIENNTGSKTSYTSDSVFYEHFNGVACVETQHDETGKPTVRLAFCPSGEGKVRFLAFESYYAFIWQKKSDTEFSLEDFKKNFQQSFSENGSIGPYTIMNLQVVNVTVPAGTFKAIHVQAVIAYPQPPFQVGDRLELWISPDVWTQGLVKSIVTFRNANGSVTSTALELIGIS